MQEEKSKRKDLILYSVAILYALLTAPLLYAEELKGKVVMVRGDNVTIQLDDEGFVNTADEIEIFMEIDGLAISYGTWRVSTVRDDGNIEGVPEKIEEAPQLHLTATIHATGTRPVSEAEQLWRQANAYWHGIDGVEQNLTKALDLYRQAAEKGGTEDVRWIRSAARQLGDAYSTGGSKTGLRDHREAFKWYLNAAKLGDHRSQARVGHFYAFGKGVEADFAEAERWYRMADATYMSSEDLERDLNLQRSSHPGKPPRPRRFYLETFAGDLSMSVYYPELRMYGMTSGELDRKINELLRESARNGSESARTKLREKGLTW